MVIATIGRNLDILEKIEHCIPYTLAIQMYFKMKKQYPKFHYILGKLIYDLLYQGHKINCFIYFLDLTEEAFKGCKFEYFFKGVPNGVRDFISYSLFNLYRSQ